jgi:ABC-type sugar transport system substrate-binding protein
MQKDGHYLPGLITSGLLILFVISGCAPQSSQRPVIALVAPNKIISNTMRDGIHAAAREQSAKLWIADPPPASLEDEAARVADALAQKPAALIIAPISPSTSLHAVQQAVNAGVPVICLENCINEPGVASAFLPGPNRDAGSLAGGLALDYIQNQLGGRGVVAMFPCNDEYGCPLRRAAFINQMEQAQGIKLIESEPQPGSDGVSSLLAAHPEVDLVWAGGEEETRSSLLNLSELGLQERIKIIGFGLDKKRAALLGADKPLYAAVVPLDYQSGYDAASTALAFLTPEKPPAAVRKSALSFTTSGPQTEAFLNNSYSYMLPALPALPPTGSGIKPSCNCSLDAHAPIPTVTP